MTKLINGKEIAQNLRNNLKLEIDNLKIKTGKVPGLAVVQVGNVAASSVYVKAKTKSAKEVGIDVFDEEPYKGPLINIERCLLTSHIGSLSEDCRIKMEVEAVEEVVRFVKGQNLRNEIPELIQKNS